MLIGQDRAGKTSLKKSFLGLPFDPNEQSTDGIEVDPSAKFEVDVDQVKNWQRTDAKLDVSHFVNDLARMAAGELKEEETKMDPKTEDKSKEFLTWKENLTKKNKRFKSSDEVMDPKTQDNPVNLKPRINQVLNREQKRERTQEARVGHHMVSHNENATREPAIPELKIDRALPPEEFTDLLVQHLKGVNLQSDTTTVENHMTLDLWDFAGQHLYYASYPVFLSSRAVYMLVYNLSKGLKSTAQPCVRQGSVDTPLLNQNRETNLENLFSWLASISTLCSKPKPKPNGNKRTKKGPTYLRPPVFIVGTHADKSDQDIKEMEKQIQREIGEKDFQHHVIRPFFAIDNTQGSSGEGVRALQKRMIEVLKEEPYMGELLPLRWLNFKKVIDALVSQRIFHLDVEKLQTCAKRVCFIDDMEEFNTMVNFYHDLGIIIKHRNTVILKAQWLIDLFRQLITIPHFNKLDPVVSNHWKELERSGVLSMELVDHVFSKFLLQDVVRDDILNMMEQFDLIAKFSPSSSDVKYFVPAQLKALPDPLCAMEPSSSDPCPLYIHFVTGFVPHGLFTKVVSRSIGWFSEQVACVQMSSISPTQHRSRVAGSTFPFKLFQNGARFIVGSQIKHHFALICKKRLIKVVIRQQKSSQQVAEGNSTTIATEVREFLERTLHDLSQNCPYLCGLQYEFCVACPYCQLEKQECTNHSQMSCMHEDCLHLLEIKEGEELSCNESFCTEILTVHGLEKWFSHSTSQESSPTLKVALLASEWGSLKGGLSTINRMLGIHLAKQPNVEVTLLVPEFECSEKDKKTAKDHNIYLCEVQRCPGFDDPLDWLISPSKDLAIDVFIGHGAKLGKQVQIIKQSRHCKWVQVVHTEPEELAMHKNYHEAIAKGEKKNKAEVALCKLADLVVTIGPKLTEAYSPQLRSCHKDIFELTPGIFANFSDVIHTTEQQTGKFTVLTFGRGDPEDLSLKGYDIAASAIVELNDSSYRLIFVGAPDGKQDKVAETLLQTGISKNQLIVRSFVKTEEELKELFCEVNVAIMPSRTEGFGLTALEAMSAGLPILVSRNSGFGEALRGLSGGKSFVVESEDPKEWAKAIAAVRQNQTQQLQEIQTLRTSYEQKYSWEKQCRSLVDKMRNMVPGVEKSTEYKSPMKGCTEDDAAGQTMRDDHVAQGKNQHSVGQVFRDLRHLQHDTASKVTNKTNLPFELKKIASDKGFIVSDNEGLGNCMFYALSEQLNLVKGIQISHEELRQSTVQYMKENHTLTDGTELFHFVDGYSSWDAYLSNMKEAGTWGDHVILHAVAKRFETCIHVISSLPHHHDLIISPEYDADNSNQLVLGHIHELHYVSLIQAKQN